MGSVTYRPAIDGLRAIAVLAVVAYHAGLPIPGGFVGVDVFFVISGYLITAILHRELRETGRINYRAFYGRRFRRIFPALIVVVASTMTLASALGPAAQLAVAKSAAASLLMLGNLHFQAVTGGYFDASADQMPLLHLWSLGVEEQFYLAWPLMLALIIRGRQVVLLLLAALSFLLAQHLLTTNPEAAFFQTHARGWELAAGAWLAIRPTPTAPPRWACAAGITLLLVAVAFPFPPSHFPAIGAVPAVCGAMLVIIGSQANGTLATRLLSSRPFVFVGVISYGLYLWHWPLLAIHRTVMLETGPVTAVALCIAAAGLATLSYRYIETPLRRGSASAHQTAAVLLSSVCVVAFAASIVPLASPALPSSKAMPQSQLAVEDPERECTVTLGRKLPRSNECRSEGANIVLWGDSHAAAWRPFALSMGAVADFSMSSCTPLIGWSTDHPRYPQHEQNCIDHNTAAIDFIRRGAKTVVVGAYLKNRMESLSSIGDGIAAIAPYSDLILLMMPTPYLKKSADQCIQFHLTCNMSREEYNAYAGPVRKAYAEIAARHDNVRVVEVVDFFCTQTECPVDRFGYPLYRDEHHITADAAHQFYVFATGEPGRS